MSTPTTSIPARAGLTTLCAALLLVTAACTKEPAKATTEAKPAAPAEGEKTPSAPETPADTWRWSVPEGLEAPAVPAENPMSDDKVSLGHDLFFDKRLSVDGSRSCYSCHQNELGNADGRAKALGPGDKELTRNTPTIWNVAYHSALYWDGRSPTLEKQMLGAWKGGNMGVGDDLAAKAAEIGGLPEYGDRIRKVFGLATADPITPDHLAMAISAYERTLLCGAAPWDTGKLEGAAQRGWELFRDKGACATCHTGTNFTDDKFHNVGIAAQKPGEGDLGRGGHTKDAAENHRFRTPTLRNVSKTAPYFHDGSVTDLREAVKYMAKGGDRSVQGLDENLADRGLTDAEIDDIVTFLGTLECPNNLAVVGDQAVPGIGAAPVPVLTPPPPT